MFDQIVVEGCGSAFLGTDDEEVGHWFLRQRAEDEGDYRFYRIDIVGHHLARSKTQHHL